jgi:hypothetical protein
MCRCGKFTFADPPEPDSDEIKLPDGIAGQPKLGTGSQKVAGLESSSPGTEKKFTGPSRIERLSDGAASVTVEIS